MKPTLLLLTLLVEALTAQAAATFIPQASFPLSLATIQAIDRDAVGNLYVLGQPSGSATYAVTSYQTHGLQPLLSFDTGSTTPFAFGVEGNGSPDVLVMDPTSGVFSLKRFGNTGALLGQTTLPYVITRYYAYSTALDKANQRVYISKYWRIQPCLDLLGGCAGPPAGTQGLVYQYDFQGNLLRTITLPGNTSANGSCYEPRVLTVDPQGNLVVADTYCQHLLRYSASGALLSDAAVGPNFYPTAIWTDSASNVYTNQSFCPTSTTCRPGIAKFSPDGNLLANAMTDASPNTGCAWDERLTYLSVSAVPPLRRFVVDDPPSVPVQTSPISAVVQHSSAAFLSWQQSNDADGDPVLYTAYLGTSLTDLQPFGQTAMTTLTGAFLDFGATYYWQVTAQDSYLGLPLSITTSPVVSMNISMLNRPPSQFSPLAGTGVAVARSSSVYLSWQTASDPDDDPVVYDLTWRTTAASTPTVITTMATSQQMSGLVFGATAYWSVAARDSYGATQPMAGGAAQTYLMNFRNAAPPEPPVTSGAGVSSQHALTPYIHLSWSPVDDPDGDAVSYRLALGTSPEALAAVQDGTATSYDLSPAYGTTYYWQVAAYDPYGGVSTTPVASALAVLRNAPPAAFAVLTGTAPVATRETAWPLSWQAASDADGDVVSYELSLSTSPQSPAVVQTSTATSCPLAFQYGTTYYWQVTARDGFGGSTASGLQSFRGDFLSVPPAAPTLVAPFTSAPTVKTMRDGVEVTWDKVTNPQGDAITYTAYLGDSPAALRAVASVEQPSGTALAALRAESLGSRPSAQAEDLGDKVRLTLSGLDYYHGYYFQVAAQNPYGAASRTSVQAFNLAPADSFPRVYNYPNPFSPNRGGTSVVFNAPASGYEHAVLTVYSEFGRKLYERDCGRVPPGISELRFDGRDRNGRALMNGSYVGRARFDGPSETATFFLLVVK